jgi:hypothetical protein
VLGIPYENGGPVALCVKGAVVVAKDRIEPLLEVKAVKNPFTSQEEIKRLRGEAMQMCNWSLVKRITDQVRGAVDGFDCKGIIIELLIKKLFFMSQIMVY